MSNYAAVVVQVDNIHPHSNANKLVCTNIFGNNIIIGKDTKIGDVGLFFPLESQLGLDFAKVNDLIRRKDENGKIIGGMFDDNRRVRAQKFRGEPSMGFWTPIDSLFKTFEFLGKEKPKIEIGQEFEELDEVSISKKYISKRQARSSVSKAKHGKKPAKSRLIDGQFHFHFDTSQLGKNIHRISPDSLIALTWKMHGCFPYNTRVRMADGTAKDISKINKGDEVLGYDISKGLVAKTKVTNIFDNGKTKEWVKIKLNHKAPTLFSNKVEAIECTPDHLFYTQRGYKKAKDLSPSDTIYNAVKECFLNEDQISCIIGKLLGDGYLDKHSPNKSVVFGHKEADEAYLDFCIDVLGPYSTGNKRRRVSGYGTNMIDAKTKQIYGLEKYLDMFSFETKKSIIKPFRLNGKILAFWYMDDGSLSVNSFQKDRAGIATCGFDNDSVKNLIESLDNIGIKATITRADGYNRINILGESTDYFFELIRKYIPEHMQYKLPEEHRDYFDYFPDSYLDERYSLYENSVKSVEFVFYEKSHIKYDIETETHNFFAKNTLVHNSSAICSYLLVKKNLKWHEKFLKFCKINVIDTHYDYIYSSRKVIKNSEMNRHYYGVDLWTEAGEKFKGRLRKGESVFYELVGFTPEGKPIQKGFDYKCSSHEYKIYIYRITQTNMDGDVLELSWPQVKSRAMELGLETVPEIYFGFAKNLYPVDSQYQWGEGVLQWNKNFLEYLQKTYVCDQDSQFCNNKVPEEGVVLRLELGEGIDCFKLKSFKFLEFESKSLDAGTIDMETQQCEVDN